MSHIRTIFSPSAPPVSTVAGGATAYRGQARLCFMCPIPPYGNLAITAFLRRQFDGIAILH